MTVGTRNHLQIFNHLVRRHISDSNQCLHVHLTPLLALTLSSPVVPNGCTSKRLGPYWSNPPFLVFLTFGRSVAQDWVPEVLNVKKIKNSRLHQYGSEWFGRLIFATVRKCGTERVTIEICVLYLWITNWPLWNVLNRCYLYDFLFLFLLLLNYYTYTTLPTHIISDIRPLWRSRLSARVPECQKLKM